VQACVVRWLQDDDNDNDGDDTLLVRDCEVQNLFWVCNVVHGFEIRQDLQMFLLQKVYCHVFVDHMYIHVCLSI